MNVVVFRPQYTGKRHHPQANSIALELLRHRDILRLRAGRLVADVRARYSVGLTTARIAVALARKAAPDVHALEAAA
jgi:hypothetical protein